MRVTHSGPFRTLPMKDKIRIVLVFPFAMTAVPFIWIYQRWQEEK